MTAEVVYTFTPGSTPLLLSMPHSGTALPQDLVADYAADALLLPDTDWHVPELYGFASALGASVLTARLSRYVIDLNRPATKESLYPGQVTTELCPTLSFAGAPLYKPQRAPSDAEIERRKELYWRPYHARLQRELDALRARFGYALLYDCHSIRSQVPRFFPGRLPDLNLGTARGASCAPSLRELLAQKLGATHDYTSVVDGRFVGGHITRAFGQPELGVHAVQMELAQLNYMVEDAPFTFLPGKAQNLSRVLATLLEALLMWRPK